MTLTEEMEKHIAAEAAPPPAGVPESQVRCARLSRGSGAAPHGRPNVRLFVCRSARGGLFCCFVLSIRCDREAPPHRCARVAADTLQAALIAYHVVGFHVVWDTMSLAMGCKGLRLAAVDALQGRAQGGAQEPRLGARRRGQGARRRRQAPRGTAGTAACAFVAVHHCGVAGGVSRDATGLVIPRGVIAAARWCSRWSRARATRALR